MIIAAAQCASIRGDVVANVRHHAEFVRLAAEHGVQLVVFPELSLTGYEPTIAAEHTISANDARLDLLRQLAAEAGMVVVAGTPVKGASPKPHIGAHAIFPDGRLLTYCKQYLHHSEEQFFTPGNGAVPFEIDGRTIALAICADTSHPEHAAAAAIRGANIYAAGVLFSEKGYAEDATQLRQYAAEHKMTVLLANHAAQTGRWVPAGKSAIWSESGDLVCAASSTEEALIIAACDNAKGQGTLVHL